MQSFRQQIQDTFGPGIDLSGGLRGSFFAPVYLERPDFYPYQDQGRISLRKTLEGWKWPLQSDYVQLANYPDEQHTAFADKLQGVTHFEDRCWIFSQDPKGVQGQITSVDIRQDLDNYPTSTSTVITETNRPFNDNEHYGACCLDDGLLVVPNHDNEPNISVFYEVTAPSNDPSQDSYYKPQITYLGVSSYQAPLSEGRASVPWSALVPTSIRHGYPSNRLLISSFFRNYPELGVLEAEEAVFLYEVSLQNTSPTMVDPGELNGEDITYPLYLKTQDGFSLDVRRIQGGTVSSAGHLYLSLDLRLSEGIGGGIHGFDLVTGRRVIYLPVDGHQLLFGEATFELEGVTTWDVDSIPNAFASSQGQVHLTVFRPRIGDRDDIWLLHWQVPQSKRAWI